MRQLHNVAIVLGVTSVICLMSCKQQAPPAAKPDLSSLTDDFVYGSLALSPMSATSAGYHEHKGVNLEDQLDDFSAAGIDQQHKFYSDFHNRLAAIQQDSLIGRRSGRLPDHRQPGEPIAARTRPDPKLSPQSDGVCGVGGQRAF